MVDSIWVPLAGLQHSWHKTLSRRLRFWNPELGMEAVWKIEVENFPAFIVVDDKGNDFYSKWIPSE
jgi:tartrate dehydratase beta subunit/fumarate hydratase class I family protein